ncbi:MAG: amino acid adenylation domain-containing protein [Acidobacteriota bacterium]
MESQPEQIIEGFRLSPQQRRLWRQMDGEVGAYRTRGRWLVEGALDVSRLRAALDELSEQYEILRTVYPRPSGMTIPLQVILDRGGYELVVEDTLAGDSIELDRGSSENGVCFDLEVGPLLKARLASVEEGRHRLALSLPALCCDAAGLLLLVRELARLYEGGAAPTKEIMQHVDLSEWFNETLDSEESEPGREFWSAVRIGDSLGLQLPFEVAPTEGYGKAFRVACAERRIGTRLTTGLEAFSRRLEVSPGDVLLVCWGALLARLTGVEAPTLAVGSPGRSYAELEQAIGPLARWLPVDFRGLSRGSLSDVVGKTRQALEESLSWQESFDWEAIAGSAEEGTAAPYLPFAYEWLADEAPISPAGIRFSREDIESCGERFRVKLTASRDGEGLGLRLHYDLDRVPGVAARRLLARFETLLRNALARPETRLGSLELLDAVERHRDLVELNDTATLSRGASRLVHQRFARVAREHPGLEAGFCEGEALTYGELAERASQLTRHLRGVGVGPGSAVALCLERSLAAPVAILATHEAGAFYAPIEPEQPAGRLQAMLEELRPAVVITLPAWRDRLAGAAPAVLCLEPDGSLAQRAIQEHAESVRQRQVEPEDLAYVLFTSGSTGRPKGVAVEHRQLLNHLDAVQRLGPPDGGRYAVVSTLAADLANTMIFSALSRGGCLDLISEEKSVDPQALAGYFEQRPADCLKIVPSHLRALLAAERPDSLMPRRDLVLGGEALPWDLVDRVHAVAPGCRVWNAYGPTETTVEVTLHQADPDARPVGEKDSESVPIGRPLANTSFYRVDDRFRAVPSGVAGELLIGGASVARGYLGQPSKTAAVFVPDPFARRRGARVYRSGDQVRGNASGVLDFLGRSDQQVKVHGYRVELGEVESALRRHPAIRDATANLDTSNAANPRLVAYLVLDRSVPPPAIEALRDFLIERLPEPMIPSIFALLESLPLTPNGKLDRRALPPPEAARMQLAGTAVRPRTPVESDLAEIWCEVLGLGEVGIRDNFFVLGGDSITSIQAVARANARGMHLTPLDLFRHQTIERLAAVAAEGTDLAIEQGPVEGELPLTPVQRRFFERRRIEPGHWNQSLLVTLHRTSEPSRLQRSLEQLITHHDALRLRFQPATNGAIRQVNAGIESGRPLTLVDLSALQTSDRSPMVEQSANQVQGSLDLAAGPVMRAACFELGETQAPRLLLVVHHLAIDAVSWQIVLEDLAVMLDGGSPPPKTTSFKSWAERLVDFTPQLTVQSDDWLRQLPEDLQALPVDHPGPISTLNETAGVTTAVEPHQTEALLQDVATAHRCSMDEILVAALAQSLARWMDTDRVLVELEGHGRMAGLGESAGSDGGDVASGDELFDGVDLTRTVGWFTTIYPVLLELPLGGPEKELLEAVRSTLRRVPSKGLSYGLLRHLDESGIGERLAQRPQPEVRFNYLGNLDRTLPAGGPFALASESRGRVRSTRETFLYKLDLVAFIHRGELQVTWTYPRARYRRTTVEGLAEAFHQALIALIDQARSAETSDYTPTDFPEADISSDELQEVLGQLSGAGGF